MPPPGSEIILAFAFGAVVSFLLVWSTTKNLLKFYKDDARFWYFQWRKTDEAMDKLVEWVDDNKDPRSLP